MTAIRVAKVGGRWGYYCEMHYGYHRSGILSAPGWTNDRAIEAAFGHWEVMHSRLIRNVCPRCGSGLPSCSQLRPDGIRWTHEETCERYEYADDVCARCEAVMLLKDER